MRKHESALLICALTACAAPPPSSVGIAQADVDTESAAVVNGLLPAVHREGMPLNRSTLEDRMQALSVPGVSIAVVRGNRLRWAVAEGVLTAGESADVTTATPMQAASISKPLVAVAVMRLVERGALRLDQPANEALVSWKIPDNTFQADSAVTIRHLVSHTAGATNGAVGIYQPGSSLPTLLQALDGRVPSSRPPVTIDFQPGTRWRYAGGGYSILQQLLIDVGGDSFPALMKRLVLEPAEMRASCFCQPLPDSLSAIAAAGHDGSGKPIPGRWWTLPEMAAGGLWSTATDLARFAIIVNRAWQDGVPGFLSRESARQMLTENRSGWALGFAVDTSSGEPRVWHSGSNNGYRSILVMYPARGDAMVILTNADGGASLRDELLRSAAVVFGWPGYSQIIRREDVAANPDLGDFVGLYRYAPRFATTIALENGSLVARLNGGAPSVLFSGRESEFFTEGGTAYRFVRDSSGAVVEVIAIFADSSELKGSREAPGTR